MARDNNLEWLQFDTDTLPAGLGKALDAYREAEGTAAALKKDFYDAFVAEAAKSGLGAPKGTEILLSFRFGNVSMAYKEIAAKTSSKPTVGFGKQASRQTGGLKPRRS